MARMRSIKPEFWVDRRLARLLKRDERMLYLALWNQADEWARLQADPRLIKGQAFPYDDDVTLAEIDAMLDALERAGVAQRYEVDGDPYLHLLKLAKHQRLEPAKVPSRLPAPPPFDADQQVHVAPQVRANESARDSDESEPDANTLPLMQVAGGREHVAGQRGANEPAPRPAARKRATQAPDALEITKAMRDWAARTSPGVNLERETARFLDHHRAKGSTFKDWTAAWRTWVSRSADYSGGQQTQLPVSSADGQRAWTSAQLDALLGPDMWRLPQPPRGISGDAIWDWEQKTKAEHRAERVRQANEKLGRTA